MIAKGTADLTVKAQWFQLPCLFSSNRYQSEAFLSILQVEGKSWLNEDHPLFIVVDEEVHRDP
jgi:hypothetical protein